MSAHATILPGLPPNLRGGSFCRGKHCRALIHKTIKGDTKKNWDEALAGGQEEIEKYQEKYNKVDHQIDCEFRDLPPSIHHGHESIAELKIALNLLQKACPPPSF